MAKIDFINPDRLRWCCKDRGVTPEALAEEVGIAWSTIEKVLDGEGGLTFGQLRKIANYFNRGVLFFLESEPVQPQSIHSQQFRTLANQKPQLSSKVRAIIERVERQRDIYLSLREDLDEYEQVRFDPPRLPLNNLSKAAGIARDWLELVDQNDFGSYRSAVEAKGILVFRSNGYNGVWQIPKEDAVCGFSIYDPHCPVIVVRKESYEPRQTFTLMHELGHVLLHRKSFVDDASDLNSYEGREREANLFANRLLVPEEALAQIEDAERPEHPKEYRKWLGPVADSLGVSVSVVLLRLLDLHRVSQFHYDLYDQWSKQQPTLAPERGSRQYRHREPRHVFGDTFVRTVLDALQARRISLVSASQYLDNLKIADVHQLEGYYAGT